MSLDHFWDIQSSEKAYPVVAWFRRAGQSDSFNGLAKSHSNIGYQSDIDRTSTLSGVAAHMRASCRITNHLRNSPQRCCSDDFHSIREWLSFLLCSTGSQEITRSSSGWGKRATWRTGPHAHYIISSFAIHRTLNVQPYVLSSSTEIFRN